MSVKSDVGDLARLLLRRLPHPFWTLALLIGGSLTDMAALMASPLLVGAVIDALGTGEAHRFTSVLLQFVVVTLVHLVLSSVVSYFATAREEDLGDRLRRDVTLSLLGGGSRSGGVDLGDATSRIVADTQVVKSSLSGVFLQPLMDLVTLVVAATLIVRVSSLIGLLTLLSAPCSVFVNRAVARRLEANAGETRIATGSMIQVVQDWLGRAPWVRLFGILPEADRRVCGVSGRLRALGRRAAGLQCQITVVATLVMVLPQLLILGIGGKAVLDAELTSGALVALMGLSAFLAPPLNRLAMLVSSALPTILPSYRRVDEAVRQGGQLVGFDGRAQERLDAVELQAVTVDRSGDGRERLAVPRLLAAAGEVVCVKGANGAGKSTLLAALVGMVPAAGAIQASVGGKRRPLCPGDVAFAPADPVLFDGSIAENVLLYGVAPPDAGPLLTWACPPGAPLDAPIAATLPGLSRGEIQKIGVARALCLGRGVLVLDEPTLGLDAASTEWLMDALRAASARGPVLVATHDDRLLAVANRTYEAIRTPDRWEITEITQPTVGQMHAIC